MMTKCQAQAAEAAATMEMVMFIAPTSDASICLRLCQFGKDVARQVLPKAESGLGLGQALISRRSGWCPHPLRRGPA